jgi:hypothetical protein
MNRKKTNMKFRFTTLILIAMTVFLASCASLVGPREVELPLAKLQESLNRKFPFNNRYLELFDISVTNPRLALQPDTNRVVTSLDAAIAPPFLKKAWNGSLTLSGILQLDATRNAIILAEPRLDKFTVDGVDTIYANQIAKIGGLLAEQILKDVPLYTFKPEDFRYAGMAFIPTKINTRPNSLVVTFEPAK